MKIITWNVNGIRAAQKKGALEWLQAQSADIVGLQEIKARPEQLTDMQWDQSGYAGVVWNPAQRPGYSGVASFYKREPDRVTLGLGFDRFDVEGRVIQSVQNGFRLFNIYFPNGQRDQERLDYKLDFYAHLLDRCQDLRAEGESIIITGDFNTAHNEIDLKNPKENQKTSGFMPVERAWIDRYIENGFVDAYRQLYPEKVEYTWWTYRFSARTRNIGWRLDYFLASEDLMPRIRDVIIHGDVLGSDHCPVTLEID
ncbi:MAG: exodeoxyribonuclease III [Anaerolineales bacterium]|nr:exodeoxyribonuclease III [Anaerolineales bacterium]